MLEMELFWNFWENFGSGSELELNGNNFHINAMDLNIVPNIAQRIGTDRGPKKLEWLTCMNFFIKYQK